MRSRTAIFRLLSLLNLLLLPSPAPADFTIDINDGAGNHKALTANPGDTFIPIAGDYFGEFKISDSEAGKTARVEFVDTNALDRLVLTDATVVAEKAFIS